MGNFQLVTAADYSDSFQAEASTLAPSTSARPTVHGQLRFTCDGTRVRLRILCGYQASAAPSRVAVYIDGAYSTYVQPTTTYAWYPLTIASGNHLVELQSSQQTGPSFPPAAGTWVDAVAAENLNVLAPATSPNWVTIEEDSIGNGEPTIPGYNDWISLFRAGYATHGRTANYSYGFRAMFDQTNHAQVALQHYRMCRGATSVRYVCVLGTNDYGLNKQTAAAYGTMYAARLAAIRTQFGSTLNKIYAVTPFTRGVESANGVGSTMAQYRAQVAAQAASDCVIVDGTAMGLSTSTDYSDSPAVHPNDLGHAKIAAYCLAQFGGA